MMSKIGLKIEANLAIYLCVYIYFVDATINIIYLRIL